MHKSTRGESYEFSEVGGGGRRGVINVGFSKTDAVGLVTSVKLSKGLQAMPHRHADWVVVTVISGAVKVTQNNGSEECVFEAGDTYLVEPGDVHTETAMEDTQVVVIAGPGVVHDKWTRKTIKLEEK